MENTNGKAAMEAPIDGSEAAKLLGIHPVTLAEMARKGLIPAFKVGRAWRYRPSRLLRWMEEQEQQHRERQQKSA